MFSSTPIEVSFIFRFYVDRICIALSWDCPETTWSTLLSRARVKARFMKIPALRKAGLQRLR